MESSSLANIGEPGSMCPTSHGVSSEGRGGVGLSDCVGVFCWFLFTFQVVVFRLLCVVNCCCCIVADSMLLLLCDEFEFGDKSLSFFDESDFFSRIRIEIFIMCGMEWEIFN